MNLYFKLGTKHSDLKARASDMSIQMFLIIKLFEIFQTSKFGERVKSCSG